LKKTKIKLTENMGIKNQPVSNNNAHIYADLVIEYVWNDLL